MNVRQQEILKAFIDLIDRNGINRTTMQDIAREMGCSVGTIYNEFANKEALIDAYAGYILDLAKASAEAVTDPALSPLAQLRELLLSHVKRVNLLMQQNRGALEIIGDVNTFRYIGKKNLNMRQEIRRILRAKTEQLLTQGVQQAEVDGTIEVESTAGVIIDAFTEYWSPPLIVKRQLEEVLADASRMFDLIALAVKKRGMEGSDDENSGNQRQPPGEERLHPNIARQTGRGRDNLRR
jgi:AcrR family transcriptional regulator